MTDRAVSVATVLISCSSVNWPVGDVVRPPHLTFNAVFDLGVAQGPAGAGVPRLPGHGDRNRPGNFTEAAEWRIQGALRESAQCDPSGQYAGGRQQQIGR